MELADLAGQIDNFDRLAPRDKIRLFAWWLHAHTGAEHFNNDAIRGCYRQLHLSPDDVSTYAARMVGAGDLIRERAGLKLGRAVRTQLDAKYGIHHSVIQVSKLLSDLPGKVPDLAEKSFLTEAINCYRVESYRACIVMTWNLAYSHLLHWILSDEARLTAFNNTVPKRYPKKPLLSFAKYDDFDELRESEVIEVCNSAGLATGNLVRILKEKLGKRNNAAHPASMVIVRSQADDVVTDLVNNVVLRLAI